MSKDDPLLDQADALMRRHRVYLAGAEATPDAVEANLEDLPLLTEEVSPEPPAAEAGELSHDRHNRLLTEQRAALAREMETWLDEQLPQLVILAMDGITDHLVSLITNRAREELLMRLDAVLQSAEKAGRDNSE